MLLKVQHVVDSALVLTAIINEKRPMPQRGKYLIARMHSKLSAEFKIINDRRDDMIKAYDTPQTTTKKDEVSGAEVTTEVEGEWIVPADKMPEFTEAWKVIGNEEIEVDVQPIPLQSLSLPNGSDGAIEAHELVTLGDLVFDSAA